MSDFKKNKEIQEISHRVLDKKILDELMKSV